MKLLQTQQNKLTDKLMKLLNNSKTLSQINQINSQLIVLQLYLNSTLAHTFINSCKSFNNLHNAYLLYSKTLKPHIFICNNLIKSLSHSKLPEKALSFYSHMNKNDVFPNNYTFPFVLKALSDIRELKNGKCVHAQVFKFGEFCDIYVGNSLMNLYASCGKMNFCRKVFDEMFIRDVVSWTVMIFGYKEVGEFENAIVTFEKMLYSGIEPNRVTMVNALVACSGSGALEMGVFIHEHVKKNGWEIDVILGSSLIDMYGKCGKIEEGLEVFENMSERNVYTWNTLIKGLALAKSGVEAIRLFSRMEFEGVKPDRVTLVGVLHACSHTGLVKLGKQIFGSLVVGKYGFSFNEKHYACMVDLLARSGYLEEGLKFINKAPFEPTMSMWGALLTGCRAHGNLELAEFCVWKAIELEPERGACYAVLSNIYALMGRWSDVEKVRILMKEKGFTKNLGSSSLDFQPHESTCEHYNSVEPLIYKKLR